MENEKRLISCDVLIAHLDSCIEQSKGLIRSVCVVIKCFVEQMPTVDAVEVVRCKDCKHKTVTSDGMVCECALPTKRMQDYYIYGSTILARVEPDAFCSYGERKDNGT